MAANKTTGYLSFLKRYKGAQFTAFDICTFIFKLKIYEKFIKTMFPVYDHVACYRLHQRRRHH